MPTKLFFQIALLRANPQDLPTSTMLMALALVAHVLADVWTLQETLPIWYALQAAAIDTLLLVAVAHTALLLRNFAHRARQTLTALAGCGAMISLITWGVVALVKLFTSSPDVTEEGGPSRATLAALLTTLPFLFWYLLLFGHVMRHALSVSLPAGVGLSLIYFILSVGVGGAVVAGPEPSGG
jgi:hypothetical protein